MADEANEPNRVTTFLSITGTNNLELQFLANLSREISEPDSNWSVIADMAHRPAINWAKVYEAKSWLTSMDRSLGGILFAVSMDGKLHSDKIGTWRVRDLRCPGLNAVWAASDDEVFAVGESATRVNVLGTVVNVVRGLPEQRLNAVHGTSPQNVLAVGDNGLILRYDGVYWNELEVATNYNLLAVFCRSETEAYVAGAQGVLMRFDGTDFKHLVAPEELIITDLAWYRDALYVASGQNGIHVLGQDRLERIKELIVYGLRTVDGLLFAWGNNLVVQFDGSGWWGGRINL